MLVQALDIYVQRCEVQETTSSKYIFKGVYGWKKRLVPVYFHVVVCQFKMLIIASPPGASQPVGAQSDCGGRELVRVVALGDVNMARLSWHRS